MIKKLGVIVPFRNRYDQIEIFKDKIITYLSSKNILFDLIIVEQDNAKLFNRGMLLNIGFNYAKKLKCDYVVFHDIDMIPIDVDYSYSTVPMHLATGFKNSKRELFDTYFGGVTMFPIETFEKIDGYSNKYWGWGFEDDDLLLRCIKHSVELDTLKIKNIGTVKKSLKFNGVDAFVKCKNIFRTNGQITLSVTFHPEKIICDHTKDFDDFNVFTIHGYDFAISYNSFSRYNFTIFDKDKNVIYLNSKIKKPYNTNITITIDNYEKIIKVYQDAVLIGEVNDFNRIYNYTKEKYFYLGSGNEGGEKYFKGFIDSFVGYSKILTDNEIQNLINGNITDDEKIIHYESDKIIDYKLKDLSGNENHGEIVNCEMTQHDFDEFNEVKIPFRRDSLFEELPHEENGFFNNKWKDQNTRWNQLRFINEVSINDELLKNDGLSTLEFIEYGVKLTNNITHINAGI
jgi:hypothetical protein